MASHLNDPTYWRERAEELRVIVERLTDTDSRAKILACARDYDVLAQRAEGRLKLSDAGRPTSK